MAKKYIGDKFEISGGTSSEFLLADGTTTTAPTGAVDSVNSQTGVVSLGLLELDDVGTDGTTGQVLTTNGSGAFSFTTVSGGGGGTVSSVNTQIGTVVLDTDDINEGTTNEYYTEARVSANSSVTSNTAKVGITSGQASDITANNSKISYTDANAVSLNTAKVGITTQQASDITANNSKVGITSAQASDITNNNSKTSYTDASAVALNTSKVGITTQQSSDITANNSKISYTDASAVAVNTAKVGITTTQSNEIIANTNKVGITTQQSNDITSNNSKISYTDSSAVALNTAKVGITTQQSSDITSNNAKTGITSQQSNDITSNNSKISYTDASAVSLNTAKVGITTTQSSNITTNNSKISFDSASSSKLAGISAGAEVNAVDSVNGTTGAVSLGLLELDDVGTDGTNGQVLTTNGSGAFSFTTVSGGVSGVSKIIAGTNVTISPTGGTGDVTINSSGSGGAAASTVLIKTNIVSATVNNALTFGSGSFFGTTLFESGTWTTTSSAITIPSDGFYSISFDILSTSIVQRATPVFTITVNGTTIEEESSHAYIRSVGGGLNDASCVLTTVLDLSSGDTIGLASRRENNASTTITTVANKSKFSITQIAAPSVTTQVNTSLETAEAARNIVIGTSATPPSGTFIENTIYFQRAT